MVDKIQVPQNVILLLKELSEKNKMPPFYSHELNAIDDHFSFLTLVNNRKKTIHENFSFNPIKLYRLKKHFDSLKDRAKTNEKKINEKKIDLLFVITEQNQLEQNIPIIKHLQKKGINSLILTNRVPLLNAIKAKNVNFILTGFYEKTQFKELRSFHYNLNSILRTINLNQKSKEIIKKIYSYIVYYHPYRKGIITQINEIINKYEPKGLFVGNDITIEGRIAVKLFKKTDKPSFMVQHGMVYNDPPFNSNHISDYFFSFGEISRNNLLEDRYLAKEIIVSGVPSIMPKCVDFQKIQVNDILIAFSGFGHITSESNFRLMIKDIIETAIDYPNKSLTIKLHPKEEISYYNNFSIPSNVKITPHSEYLEKFTSIYQYLQKFDLLVTGSSTVALEAMTIGLPVISMDFRNEYSMNTHFIKNSITDHFHKEKMFSRFLNDVTFETLERVSVRQKEYIKKYYAASGDKACEIIFKKVNEILKCVE